MIRKISTNLTNEHKIILICVRETGHFVIDEHCLNQLMQLIDILTFDDQFHNVILFYKRLTETSQRRSIPDNVASRKKM